MTRVLRGRRAAFVGCIVLMGVPAALGQPASGGEKEPLPEAWFFSQRTPALKELAGKPAPELELKEWIGSEVSAEDTKGKVVVIDFWGTWCGPCMAAIPKNVEMVKKYKDQGLVFIGVHDANRGWQDAQKAVNDHGINYSVALDADGGKSAKAFKLAFWPTYVVVDRAGVVRGAGLMPGNVEDAVKLLLAEPAPAVEGADEGGLAPEFYFGGEMRPRALRAVEGQEMPEIEAEAWAGDELDREDLAGRVAVVHFLSSGSNISLRQGAMLAELEEKIGPQGVVFVAVGRPGDDWERMSRLREGGKLPRLMCRDQAVEGGSEGSMGVTAAAFGVRFAPVTVVVDRSGVVRGAGVRPEKIETLAGMLLAEAVTPGPGEKKSEKPGHKPGSESPEGGQDEKKEGSGDPVGG